MGLNSPIAQRKKIVNFKLKSRPKFHEINVLFVDLNGVCFLKPPQISNQKSALTFTDTAKEVL